MKPNKVNKALHTLTPNPQLLHRVNSPLIDIERKINLRFKSDYYQKNNFYDTLIINQIISNERSHIVAEFKDYLILGDMSEFLQEYYQRIDCKMNLPKIFEYYDSCSVIFPNYVILPESKYLYKNIQKKQKVIDHQQELEQELEKKKKKQKSMSISNEEDDDSDKVFETKVFDSLLNQTNTSTVHQLLGVNCNEGNDNKDKDKDKGDEHKDENIEEDDAYFHNKITLIINAITTIEMSQQNLTDRYKRSCLKKDSLNMRYANCTTTTKDKSSNGPHQMPIKRKMIISNILSSDKNILMRSIKDMNYNKSARRPLSNDNSHNASRLKDNKKQISSSSSINTISTNQKAIAKAVSPQKQSGGCGGNNNYNTNNTHIHYVNVNANVNVNVSSSNNNLSIHKTMTKLQNAPYTTRESKLNTDLIQLLTSKLLKIKSISKQTSISQFRKQQRKINKNVSLLSTGASSHVHCQGKDKDKDREKDRDNQKGSGKDKEKIYDNLYDKYENSPKIRKINHNHNHNPNTNRNRNELAGNNKTNFVKVNNNMLEHQFSLSPSRQNELATKTCTQLPSSTSFTKDKLKKTTNAVIPRKELLIKGIQIKGFEEILKKSNSRNKNCISDRLCNKHRHSGHKLLN